MSHTIVDCMIRILAAVLSSAARSLIIGCIVAAALAAFGVKGVHVKLLVWRALLAVALAMPSLIFLCPAISLAVPVPDFGRQSAAIYIPPAPVAAVHASALPSDVAAPMPGRRTEADEEKALAPLSDSPLPRPSPARMKISWRVLAAIAYFAIAMLFFARIVIGIRLANRLRSSALRIDDEQALETLSSVTRAAGLRREPRLAESESLAAPLMLGIRNPIILFPADWRRWDADELAAVLAHEVSHVRRQDALAQRLALIHRAIFWFSPLAWWLERELAELAEQASDEAALAGGADRTRYAEALLEFFAELEAVPRRAWWEGVSMAKTGQAEKRVERILAWRGAMSNKLTKSLVIALVVVAAPVVVLTAAARPAFYDVQAPPAPPAPPAPSAPDPAAAAPDPNPASAQAPMAAPAPPAPPADDSEVHIVIPPMPAIPPMHIDVPPVNVDLPQLHVAVPQIHIETRALAAMPQQDFVVQPPMTLSMSGDWNFYRAWPGGYWVGRYYDWGPRFAIVTKDSDDFMISGDREDAEHARELKRKLGGDFIWFTRDEKSYVINDPATVNRAKQLWQPSEDLSKQQKDFGKQMQDLSKQMEASQQKFQDTKIKLPDLTAEMQKLEESMKQLSANGGTFSEIGELQRQIGELQRQIGQVESAAGRDRGAWGSEQSEWGRKMGELGRQQGELGRKQAELAREASRQMQQLLDDAVSKGLAKPE